MPFDIINLLRTDALGDCGVQLSGPTEPDPGRVLYSAMKRAGFSDVSVKIRAGVDTQGRMLPVLENMASYAKAGGALEGRRLDIIMDEIGRSIAEGTFMMALPQFLVTGRA